MVRPDPIPNSAVKRRIADGSACIACARVGSRRLFLTPLIVGKKQTPAEFTFSGCFVLSDPSDLVDPRGTLLVLARSST